MYKLGKTPPRLIESFGVSGVLDDDCRIFYDNLFDTAHVGKISDILSARLSSLGPDELKLRAILLFTMFEAYRPQISSEVKKGGWNIRTGIRLDSPMVVECGIDSEKIAVGISFTLPVGDFFELNLLEDRVDLGKPKGGFEELLVALQSQADQVILRVQPSTQRYEVVALISLPDKIQDLDPTRRKHIEIIKLGKKIKTAPKAREYETLADINYSALLQDELEEGEIESPSSGEIIADVIAEAFEKDEEEDEGVVDKLNPFSKQKRKRKERDERIEKKRKAKARKRKALERKRAGLDYEKEALNEDEEAFDEIQVVTGQTEESFDENTLVSGGFPNGEDEKRTVRGGSEGEEDELFKVKGGRVADEDDLLRVKSGEDSDTEEKIDGHPSEDEPRDGEEPVDVGPGKKSDKKKKKRKKTILEKLMGDKEDVSVVTGKYDSASDELVKVKGSERDQDDDEEEFDFVLGKSGNPDEEFDDEEFDDEDFDDEDFDDEEFDDEDFEGEAATPDEKRAAVDGKNDDEGYDVEGQAGLKKIKNRKGPGQKKKKKTLLQRLIGESDDVKVVTGKFGAKNDERILVEGEDSYESEEGDETDNDETGNTEPDHDVFSEKSSKTKAGGANLPDDAEIELGDSVTSSKKEKNRKKKKLGFLDRLLGRHNPDSENDEDGDFEHHNDNGNGADAEDVDLGSSKKEDGEEDADENLLSGEDHERESNSLVEGVPDSEEDRSETVKGEYGEEDLDSIIGDSTEHLEDEEHRLKGVEDGESEESMAFSKVTDEEGGDTIFEADEIDDAKNETLTIKGSKKTQSNWGVGGGGDQEQTSAKSENLKRIEKEQEVSKRKEEQYKEHLNALQEKIKRLEKESDKVTRVVQDVDQKGDKKEDDGKINELLAQMKKLKTEGEMAKQALEKEKANQQKMKLLSDKVKSLEKKEPTSADPSKSEQAKDREIAALKKQAKEGDKGLSVNGTDNSQVEALKNKLKALERKESPAVSVLAEKEKEIQALKAKMSDISTTISSTPDKGSERHIKSLEGELLRLKQEQSKAKQSGKSDISEVAALRKKAAELEAAKKKLESDGSTKENSEANEARKRLEKLELEKKKIAFEAEKKHKAEIEALKKQLAASSGGVNEPLNGAKDQEIARLKKEIAKSRIAKDEKNAPANPSAAQVPTADASKRNQELELQIKKLESEKRKLDTEKGNQVANRPVSDYKKNSQTFSPSLAPSKLAPSASSDFVAIKTAEIKNKELERKLALLEMENKKIKSDKIVSKSEEQNRISELERKLKDAELKSAQFSREGGKDDGKDLSKEVATAEKETNALVGELENKEKKKEFNEKAEAIKKEPDPAILKQKVDALMSDMHAERGKAAEMSKKLQSSIKTAQHKFLEKERKFKDDLKRKEELLSQNASSLSHAKEQIAQLRNKVALFQEGGPKVSDDGKKIEISANEKKLSAKLLLQEKLAKGAKEETAQIQKKMAVLQDELSVAKKAVKPQLEADFTELRKKFDSSKKQQEELKRTNSQLLMQLKEAQSKKGVQSTSQKDDSGARVAQMQRVAQANKEEANKFKKKLEAVKSEEVKLKREVQRLQNDLQKAKKGKRAA